MYTRRTVAQLENEAITMICFQDFTTIFILFPLVLIQPKRFFLHLG